MIKMGYLFIFMISLYTNQVRSENEEKNYVNEGGGSVSDDHGKLCWHAAVSFVCVYCVEKAKKESV